MGYIVSMTYETAKKRLPAGTKVAHKDNPRIQGIVVGKSFGAPASYNVRVHLTCGLIYDVTPYALKKVEEFIR